jgi:aspartokinase
LFGINSIIGVLGETGKKLAEHNISIEFPTAGIDDLSFIVREKYLKNKHPNFVTNILKDLERIVGEETNVDFREGLGALVVAGKNLKGNIGVAGEILQSLANNRINLKFLSQRPNERSIAFGINDSDAKLAVNAVYENHVKY